MVSPTLFFNITAGCQPLGCICFKLFEVEVPKTAENFHALSIGQKGFGYKIPPFTELFQDSCAKVATSNTGGRAIYRETFEEENFILKHTGPGILSIANTEPNTYGSSVSPPLQGLSGWMANVDFGKVKEGVNIMEAREHFGSRNKTSKKITIADCGQL